MRTKGESRMLLGTAFEATFLTYGWSASNGLLCFLVFRVDLRRKIEHSYVPNSQNRLAF